MNEPGRFSILSKDTQWIEPLTFWLIDSLLPPNGRLVHSFKEMLCLFQQDNAQDKFCTHSSLMIQK